jgi:hypothetical protein
MKKEFTPYDRALKLKAIGFDESCFGFYSKIYGLVIGITTGNGALYENAGECLAPTFSQAFRWFREKYNLHSLIGIYPNTKEWYSSYQDLNWSGKETLDFNKTEDRSIRFKTYEEAELACLKKLIEIVETKQQEQ